MAYTIPNAPPFDSALLRYAIGSSGSGYNSTIVRTNMQLGTVFTSAQLLGKHHTHHYMQDAKTITRDRSTSSGSQQNCIEFQTDGWLRYNSSTSSTTCNANYTQWCLVSVTSPWNFYNELEIKYSKTSGTSTYSSDEQWQIFNSYKKRIKTGYKSGTFGSSSTWYGTVQIRNSLTLEVLLTWNLNFRNT